MDHTLKSFIKFLFLFDLCFISYAQASPLEISGESLLTKKTVSLSSQTKDKKGLVVVFLSAQCPCSNSHVPILKSLSETHSEFNFIAVHSNTNEKEEISRIYFSKANLPFDVIEDKNTKIADSLKANKTPHAFIIAPNGEALYQGGVTNSSNAPSADRNYLAEALEDLRQGKSVRTQQGRTLGCAIVREGEQNVW